MTDTLKFDLKEQIIVKENCGCCGETESYKGSVINIDNAYLIKDENGDEFWHYSSCLTKLQEKPMQNMQDIKVGDQVRVLSDANKKFMELDGMFFSDEMYSTLGKIGVVEEIGKNKVLVNIENKRWHYSFNVIEKIPQETEQVGGVDLRKLNQRILEVGDRVLNNDETSANFEQVGYIVKHESGKLAVQYSCDGVFLLNSNINRFNLLIKLPPLLKKHSEPFKHKKTYYFAYGEEDYIKDFPCELFRADVRCIWSSIDEVKADGNFNPEYCLIGKITLDAMVEYDVKE
jgi:hypothetical protein